ncbi:MAG: lytic murein transglycosylase [Desulforhopalus sp.]|nr:lytic murein transglycosylase [Desulforhopalus sp.]
MNRPAVQLNFIFLAETALFAGQHLMYALAGLLVCFLLGISFPNTISAAQSDQQAADLVTENQPIDITNPQYLDLFRELQEQYHFPEPQLQQLFAKLHIDRKVLQLMDRQGEAKPYHQYRSLFISPMTIAIGKQNLAIHQRLFDRIEERYQVDREAIVAIWSIESRFGTSQGNFSLFQTLNTLFAAYPRRSAFYRKELINFLILCRDNGFDPWSIKGSYAGAFGQAQFMPSSFNTYAVDFDGDQRPDIVNSLPDIFASIAHYLKEFGWIFHTPLYAELGRELRSDMLIQAYTEGRKGRVDWRRLAKIQDVSLPQSPGDMPLSIVGLELAPQDGSGMRYIAGYPNMHAINEYNHSSKYAMAVAEMAESLKN